MFKVQSNKFCQFRAILSSFNYVIVWRSFRLKLRPFRATELACATRIFKVQTNVYIFFFLRSFTQSSEQFTQFSKTTISEKERKGLLEQKNPRWPLKVGKTSADSQEEEEKKGDQNKGGASIVRRWLYSRASPSLFLTCNHLLGMTSSGCQSTRQATERSGQMHPTRDRE